MNSRTYRRLVVAAVLLAVLMPGCPARRGSLPAGGVATELVWPAAPDPPRVRYVASLRRLRDVGVKRSFLGRVADIFLGPVDDRFVRPSAVAVRGALVAVADPGVPAVFVVDRDAGAVVTITGAGSDPFVSPVGVALSGSGDVYVADSYLGRIFRFDRKGVLRGAWTDASLERPTSLAFEEERKRLYAVDARTHRVRVYDEQGRAILSFGGRGAEPGKFNWPGHLCLDHMGRVYVVDALNFRVQTFDPDGRFLGFFGHHGDGSGDFARAKGIAVDQRGTIYVVDALFDTVQLFDSEGRFLMAFGEHGTGPGQFWLATGIAIDDRDRIYVADSYNRRIQVFQLLGGSAAVGDERK